MRRCLELAARGRGQTAPNPMVGAVIVHNDRILGEGHHRSYGGPHAEVNAINAVQDQSLFPESDLYVSLEPCSHHGKTPPCTDLVLEKGIGRVFIGTADPNPSVPGGGAEKLRREGREVVMGLLSEECVRLNRHYFTFHRKKRPYIILKWARTEDGFVDRLRTRGDKATINWITDPPARALVHKWRSEVQAIMAGNETLIRDDPKLTLREWPGNHPLRVVADRKSRLPRDLHVFDGEVPTVVFSAKKENDRKNLSFAVLSSEEAPLTEVLDQLYEMNIQSMLVEGGPGLHREFIKRGLWDEARIFTGSLNFGSGVPAPDTPAVPSETTRFSGNLLEICYNNSGIEG